MHKIKNTAPGPRIVYTAQGDVLLDPGQSCTAEFSEGEIASMEARGDLMVSAVEPPAQVEGEISKPVETIIIENDVPRGPDDGRRKRKR